MDLPLWLTGMAMVPTFREIEKLARGPKEIPKLILPYVVRVVSGFTLGMMLPDMLKNPTDLGVGLVALSLLSTRNIVAEMLADTSPKAKELVKKVYNVGTLVGFASIALGLYLNPEAVTHGFGLLEGLKTVTALGSAYLFLASQIAHNPMKGLKDL